MFLPCCLVALITESPITDFIGYFVLLTPLQTYLINACSCNLYHNRLRCGRWRNGVALAMSGQVSRPRARSRAGM